MNYLGWCQPSVDKKKSEQRTWLTLTIIIVMKWDTCSFHSHQAPDSETSLMPVFFSSTCFRPSGRAVANLAVPGGQEFYFPHFFLKFLSFSSNFAYFLPHFGPPGGRVAHPGRPWLCHCHLELHNKYLGFWNSTSGPVWKWRLKWRNSGSPIERSVAHGTLIDAPRYPYPWKQCKRR